jgi:hypothetical protein
MKNHKINAKYRKIQGMRSISKREIKNRYAGLKVIYVGQHSLPQVVGVITKKQKEIILQYGKQKFLTEILKKLNQKPKIKWKNQY